MPPRDGDSAESSALPPRFPSLSLDELLSLPENSVGKVYARFMESRKFDPADRPQVDPRLVSEPDLAWVLQRYRDVHDMWHVLNCMPTTLLGELGQKWFEAFHTGLPVAAFSSVFGPLRLKPAERRVLFRDLVPWAAAAGTSCVNLLAIRYDDYLHRDVDEMRREWNLLSPQPYLKEPHILYKRRRTDKKDAASHTEPAPPQAGSHPHRPSAQPADATAADLGNER
jgi:ubiquinone biosynthesis protein COQ4